MQPHPDAEFPQRGGEIEEPRPHVAIAPAARRILEIDPVGGRILRDDEQFLDAGSSEPLSLAQDIGRRPRDEIAAQARDDAEGATIIAALRNLQIRIVARRQLDSVGRHQVEE